MGRSLLRKGLLRRGGITHISKNSVFSCQKYNKSATNPIQPQGIDFLRLGNSSLRAADLSFLWKQENLPN